MTPKYQIFVSSTYDDLKDEREQVIKAILEMGHIPVGMEMFSAADEEQWMIIQRQIDSSDYYVVIVAHRYGSIVDGISYTEKEYDYAASQGVPTLGFVIDKGAVWPHEKFDSDTKKKKSLESFKSKIKKKPVQFWTTKKDLYGQVAIALGKTFNTQPRPGWVRSDSTIGPEVSEEIARSSKENAYLRQIITDKENNGEIISIIESLDLNNNIILLNPDDININISRRDAYIKICRNLGLESRTEAALVAYLIRSTINEEIDSLSETQRLKNRRAIREFLMLIFADRLINHQYVQGENTPTQQVFNRTTVASAVNKKHFEMTSLGVKVYQQLIKS